MAFYIPIPSHSHSHSQTIVQSLQHKHFWRIKNTVNIQYHSSVLVTVQFLLSGGLSSKAELSYLQLPEIIIIHQKQNCHICILLWRNSRLACLLSLGSDLYAVFQFLHKINTGNLFPWEWVPFPFPYSVIPIPSNFHCQLCHQFPFPLRYPWDS